MIKITENGYTRINRTEARKLYDNGGTVIATLDRVAPHAFNTWGVCIELNGTENFDTVTASALAQLKNVYRGEGFGRRLAFYVR